MDVTEERHTNEKISFLFCKIFSKKLSKFVTKILQNKKARRLRVNHRGSITNLLPYQDTSKKFTCNLRPCPALPLKFFRIRAR